MNISRHKQAFKNFPSLPCFGWSARDIRLMYAPVRVRLPIGGYTGSDRYSFDRRARVMGAL